MVDPKESKELSAEEMASISGGFPGVQCPHAAEEKLWKNPKIIDEGKTIRVSKKRKDDDSVSGQVVN